MKHLALLALALSTAGCAGGVSTGGVNPSAAPVRVVGSLDGSGQGPQVLAGYEPNVIAMNALIRYQGKVTYTVQPFFPPYLTLDGSYEIIVEAAPGKEAEAISAVESGNILIRRDGKPGALNQPGSIRAYKQALRAAALRSWPPPLLLPFVPPPSPAAKAKATTCLSPDCEIPSCR